MSTFLYSNTDQRRVGRVFSDLIRGRELLLDLVWKDIRVRYRYAVMGFLWAVMEPLALMLVLTFVFEFVLGGEMSRTGPTGEDAPPYATVLLCGLIFWQFMANALSSSTQSLIDNQNLVKKVFFPREIVPLAAIGYPLVNLGIGFLLLMAVHLLLGGAVSVAFVWFPVVFAIQLLLTIGLALLLSCGNVCYRDIGYMVTVGIVFGFYASPIFYELDFVTTSEKVPAWGAKLYQANPMAGLLTAYRQILFEHRFPDIVLLAWPALLAVGSFVVGVVVFRRKAPTLSDHL
jgi:ABC-type polysaccharide/polyol phosphate export permease